MLKITPQHIIAIGASAGGMDEINSFFDHTPSDGVSYIVIQHLSKDFKSRMAELLARHSKLAIQEAENGTIVECNQVYLIPSDKFMTIHKGRLHLTDKTKEQLPHLTIDTFFNSLALDCGKKAIGVVLSGLGRDGTEGVKAIKRKGGMVIARNTKTTAFAAMPANAIASGAVDFILEPRQMPAVIENYISNQGDIIAGHKDDGKILAAIVELIKETSPLDFSEYKLNTILRRTKRRAFNANFTTLAAYFNFLKVRPEEVDALAKDFLISVTSFFRDKAAFEVIEKNIFPAILDKLAPGEELRIWVAGCATGEEAYSLAILAQELLAENVKGTIVKIFATDIDSTALLYAEKGLYKADIENNISAQRLEKHFLKEYGGYKIKPVLRKMVIFAQHNLVKNLPYCNLHFISCRNLMIYMTPALQKKTFSMLLFGLKKEGYLFLGSSENPAPIIKNLEVLNKKWKLYKNLELRKELHADTFLLPELIDRKQENKGFKDAELSKNAVNALADLVSLNLANEFEVAVLCLDNNSNVIQSYGNTAKYLLQKNFNPNLEALLPKPLAMVFNVLKADALKFNKRMTAPPVIVKNGLTLMNIHLSVSPLTSKKLDQSILMVTIREDKPSGGGQYDNVAFDEEKYFNRYVFGLEEELKDLKDKLKSTYEQIDTSNENLQSFNEELLSANEEMQSTNEEMQSVNEELDTINSNYQLKNKELLEINDDLNNYFRSNVNGQMFINNELQLMRFSPGTVEQINLRESDIGRPISHITTNIKFETITDDIKKVLKEGCIITKEIETNNDKWYQVMTMPYLGHIDNMVTGVIVTFNDITNLKKTQLELDLRNESLQRINEDLDNFARTASHDLLNPLGNIEMSIDLMNQEITDPEQKEFLTIINSSVKIFRTLVSDLATVVKLEHDMIATEMVDLDELMDNIEWSLEHKIKLSDAKIIRMFDTKSVLFSKKNLRSILYNLISNGIKFKKDSPPLIHVEARIEKGHTMLSVKDNGIGIDKSGLDKIFDMYGRLNYDIDGQGIGLCLIRKLVNAAGGNIAVESKIDEGSKFIIHFKN